MAVDTTSYQLIPCDFRSVQALWGRTSYYPVTGAGGCLVRSCTVVTVSCSLFHHFHHCSKRPFPLLPNSNNRLGPFGSFSIGGVWV